MRRTKIVATLGPASASSEVIKEMIDTGVDVFRLNYSHGTQEEKHDLAKLIRVCSEDSGRIVGILADLQGPKIRTHKFKEGCAQLVKGEAFILDADLAENDGDNERVGITYKDLPNDVKEGDTLLLDDGRVVLKVDKVVGSQIHCVSVLPVCYQIIKVST